jgi:serine/threonine protein kinase
MPPRLAEFVANAIRSGLLTPEDLADVRARFQPEPADDAASRLARLLVGEGKLTAYQARKLLAGAVKGFFLGGYRVLRRIGEGGMGKVFLARRESDGELVAIKVLPPRKAMEDELALARFQRETELSRRVVHANLAHTLDVGVEDGVYFMVLEYVLGDSLYNMVRGRDGGPWRVPDTARYFIRVLDGLAAAHAAGLVHRDLKPSNLMVTPEGDAKVLDLGLARVLDEEDADRLTGPNVVVGTLDYASPEQLSDAAHADARSDLYSIGCSIYFTLAGRPPFEGGDIINKIFKHRMEDPTPLEKVARGVPAAFAAIVRKAMAKDPHDRYQSVKELRADLRRWTDPQLVRSLLGADADSARAFRPPPPRLEEDDLRLFDERPEGSGVASSILSEAEPVPAPRRPPIPTPRPALTRDDEISGLPVPGTTPEPATGSPVWWIKWIAALCVLAALVVALIALLR